MKILFVSDTYYPHINGVYYFVCRIAPLLQENGHQVAVVAPSASFSYTINMIDNIKVYGVPSIPTCYYPNLRLPLSPGLRTRLNRIVEVFKPDVIHVQDHFLIAKTIVSIARNTGIPVVGTNHFMPENLTVLFRSEKLKRWIEEYSWSQFSKLFNQLTMVTTPTETAAELIRPKLKNAVTAISGGIDLREFSAHGDIGAIRRKYAIPDKPVLLYVGRLDPEKRIEEVLEAVSRVSNTVDMCVVIVGKGLVRAALERQAYESGISDRVIFTGFVPDKDLPFIYQLSRCFIIASIAELLSLATLQAMACGLPVIAANAGALPELVNGNGYLFQPGDIAAIGESICEIFTQDNLHLQMSRKSLELVRKHDIHKVVASFEEIYERLLTKKATFIKYSMIAL